MSSPQTVLVVGAGVVGASAALALKARGHRVSLLAPGPLPNKLGSSVDISRIVRLEYGSDELYMELAEKALAGWHQWNDEWGVAHYHVTGLLLLSRTPMAPCGFEYESFRLLEKRGHHPERLDAARIGERFPAWKNAGFAGGFFHAPCGYAQARRVNAKLVNECRKNSVAVIDACGFKEFLLEGGRVTGVRGTDGRPYRADTTVMATGAWTGKLLGMPSMFRSTAHPVFYLKPKSPDLFRPDVFPVFTADISTTGWYGFSLGVEGVVKLATHGQGRVLDPDDPNRTVTDADTARLREFLETSLPDLADAEITESKACLYSDTPDGHFLIDHDPERKGLLVAAGGSGHGFKFAPVFGELVCDRIEGKENTFLDRFKWRTPPADTAGEEQSRARKVE